LYSGSLRFQCYMASKRQPHFCNLPQTVNGPSKRESLQDRRASSVEKGDVGTLDSLLDTHREHLRLRHLLVGDKSKRSNKGPGSPYHSPVGRGSPLMSPLVGDPAAIQALNLDPSCPNVPEDVYRLAISVCSLFSMHIA
jgi:hypothetical protein